VTRPTLQRRAVDRLREWSYAHPRARILLREGWGISRDAAHAVHLPAPFEPVEMDDLRRLRDTACELPRAAVGRLLILSTRGWSTHTVTEATIAHAARCRGWEPVFAMCGGRLPVCDVAPVHAAPPMPCHSCAGYAHDAIAAAGFDPIRVKDLVDIGALTATARARTAALRSVADCDAYSVDSFALGRFVRTSVAWFLSRGTLLDDAETLRTYRSFLVSGMVLREAFTQLLDQVRPDRILVLNGAFFPERILAELASRREIPVTRYEKGFLTDTVLAGRWRAGADDLDPGEATWHAAAGTALTADQLRTIETYLDERVRGGRTLDNFWATRVEDAADIRAGLRLRDGHPVVGVFLNILWDSAIQDKDVAFPSMGRWLVEVVRWAQRNPSVDVVLRVHPAEVKLANHVSRERMADHIATQFARLPDNVRVVHAESDVSSYALIGMTSVGLVYTSTIGLEMAAQGIPVICAAKTHYGKRGFTLDPDAADDYWRALETAVAAPPEAEERARIAELARRYAYLFFFRYHQFLEVVHEEGRSRPRVTVMSADDLAPGRHAGLDRVVDGVLTGDGPVITPATAETH